MSLWNCPEHGLYGGDVFCPQCGAIGDYATVETQEPIMPQGNNEYGVTQEALDWLKAQIDTPDDSGIVRVPGDGLADARNLAAEIMVAVRQVRFPKEYADEAHDEFESMTLTPMLQEALTRTQADDRKRIGELEAAIEQGAYHVEQARTLISCPPNQTADKHIVTARWHLDKIREARASLSKPLSDGE